MAILLALFSAFAYGLSDFVGGLVSRRVSAWPVAVVGQLSSTACTAAVALVVKGSPTPADLAWALLAGIGTGVGTGFLYRGFAAGRMSVVAPVSAVGAAVVPVVVGAVGGERLSLVVWTGIVVALPGIWLVSSTIDELPDGAAKPRGSLAEGVLDGVLAGLGFGVLFAALGQVPEEAGLWPLALAQAVSLPAVIVLAVSLGAAWVPRRRQA
ncbi:MAG: EamA family transporter, partial [Nocardioidaceae bacterium]